MKLILRIAASINTQSTTTQNSWRLYIDGSNTDNINNVEVDQTGNIYIGGQYVNNSTVFDKYLTQAFPVPVASLTTGSQGLIAKITNDGLPQFVNAVVFNGSGSGSTESSIAVDTGSNVYYATNYYSPSVTGTIYNSDGSIFSPAIPTANPNKCVMVKFNSNGFAQWWVRAHGTANFNNDWVFACGVDAQNNPIFGGYYNNSNFLAYDWNGSGNTVSPLTFPTNNGGNTGYIIKYNTNGIAQWRSVVQMTSGWSSVDSICSDPQSNVYYSGFISSGTSPIVYWNGGTTSITVPLGQCAYTIKLNDNGTYVWRVMVDGTSNDVAYGVAIDSAKNLYMAGQYGPNSATIYNASVTSNMTLPAVATNPAAFLVKFDSNGTCIWRTYINGASTDVGYSVAVDKNDNVYLAGTYNTSATLYDASTTITDPATSAITLPTVTGNGAFLVKYNSSGVVQWRCVVDGANSENAYGVKLDSNNNVVLTGQYGPGASTIYHATGTSTLTLPALTTNPGGFVILFNSNGVLQPYTILQYPPIALTSDNTTISGQAYGNGTYATSASTFYNAGGISAPWKAFNKTTGTSAANDEGNCWATSFTGGNQYNSVTGNYQAGLYSFTMSGTVYSGEWLRIQLPTSIVLTSYSVQARFTYGLQAPRSWALGGSNDGTTWTLIETRSAQVYSNNELKIFTIGSTPAAYTYYAMCFTQTQIGNGNGIGVGEWRLYGTPDSEYPPTALTGSSTVVSGQLYGNGTYTTTQGTSFSSSFNAWYAFDKTVNNSGTSRWATAGGYNPSTGAYGGALTTAGYSGDWLQITMPAQILVTSYSVTNFYNDFTAAIANTPVSWVLLGSDDGTTWTVIDTQTNLTWTAGSFTTKIFSVSITTKFAIYRMVVTKMGNGVDSNLTLQELRLYGY